MTVKLNGTAAEGPSPFVAVTVPLYVPLAVTVNVGLAKLEEAGVTPGVATFQDHDKIGGLLALADNVTTPPTFETTTTFDTTGGIGGGGGGA